MERTKGVRFFIPVIGQTLPGKSFFGHSIKTCCLSFQDLRILFGSSLAKGNEEYVPYCTVYTLPAIQSGATCLTSVMQSVRVMINITHTVYTFDKFFVSELL
jgi:hypothetical protein